MTALIGPGIACIAMMKPDNSVDIHARGFRLNASKTLEAINRCVMKPNTLTRTFIGISVAIFVTAFSFSSQAAQQGTARVIKLTGAARYSTGNNYWQPVSVGTVLKPGSVIQTASESSVDILLSGEEDLVAAPLVTPAQQKLQQQAQGGRAFQPNLKPLHNVVRLREHTLLAIDRLTWEQTGADTVTETLLDLRAGTIFGSVKKSSAASRYEVKLPNGVAGIRGTIYSLSVSGVLTVYTGSVVVTFVNPDNPSENITRVVNAGQSLDMNSNTFSTVPVGGIQDSQKTADEMSKQSGPGTTTYYAPEPVVHLSPVVGSDIDSGDGDGGGPVGPQ